MYVYVYARVCGSNSPASARTYGPVSVSRVLALGTTLTWLRRRVSPSQFYSPFFPSVFACSIGIYAVCYVSPILILQKKEKKKKNEKSENTPLRASRKLIPKGDRTIRLNESFEWLEREHRVVPFFPPSFSFFPIFPPPFAPFPSFKPQQGSSGDLTWRPESGDCFSAGYMFLVWQERTVSKFTVHFFFLLYKTIIFRLWLSRVVQNYLLHVFGSFGRH